MESQYFQTEEVEQKRGGSFHPQPPEVYIIRADKGLPGNDFQRAWAAVYREGGTTPDFEVEVKVSGLEFARLNRDGYDQDAFWKHLVASAIASAKSVIKGEHQFPPGAPRIRETWVYATNFPRS